MTVYGMNRLQLEQHLAQVAAPAAEPTSRTGARPEATPAAVLMSRLVQHFFLWATIIGTSGCIMGPYDKQELRSTAEEHWFSGYTIAPSMEIRVLAFNRSTQTWITVATTVSSANPSIPANVWYDNPDLYPWSVPATFSNSCFYNSNCLPPSDDYGLRTVRIRVEQGPASSPNNLIVFDDEWLTCMNEQMARGTSFVNAAYNCRSTSYPELRLRHVAEWWKPAALPVASPPAVGGVTGELTVAVSDGSTIRISRNSMQSAIPGWTALANAPSAGIAVDVAPAIARTPDQTQLRLFARGNDGLMYSSSRVGAWTGLLAVPQITGLMPGRISAALGSSTISHLTHVSLGGTVSYWRLEGQTVNGAAAHLDTFAGIEATVGSRGADHALVVVRGTSNLSVWAFSAASSWAPMLIGTIDSGAVEDISEVVYYGSSYHFLYARIGMLGYGEVVHVSTRGNAVGDINPRTVGSYANGATPARVAIAVSHSRGLGSTSQPTIVHGHLLAAWRDTSPGIQSARWDRAQADARWLRGPTIGATTMLAERPVLAAADLRPFGQFDLPAFGNDVFIAAKGADGRARFANFTRGMMRREVALHFDLFALSQSTGCSIDNNVPDAVWLEDLMVNDRPIISELGALYWSLPGWLTDEVYRGSAQSQCEQSLRQPATAFAGRACELEKTPIVVKPIAGLYVCPDGAYVNHDSFVTAIWEEVGHVTASALGFHDSSTQPNAWNAGVTDIALAELQAGYALFGQSLTGCGGLPRCPGFTGTYDTTSRQHSFIYAMAAYMFYGAQMRAWIAADLQRPTCNDLLARKYIWIRDNIFPGVEFDDRGEPALAPASISTCSGIARR